MKILFKLAFKNIVNYSKQSKSTLLSLASAFISLVLFQGYITDLDLFLQETHSHKSMFGDFIIEHKLSLSSEAKKEPWKFYLQENTQKMVKEIISKYHTADWPICSVLRISGMIQKKSQQFLFIGNGFDVENCRRLRLPYWEKDTLFGRSLYQSPLPDKVLLGQTLAKNFDCEKKDKIRKHIATRKGYDKEIHEFECLNGDEFNLSVLTVNSQINSLDFNILGIIDGGFIELDARTIQLSLVKAQELYDTKGVSYLTFFSESLKNDKKLFKQIQDELPPEVRILSWKDHEEIGDFYKRTMGLMKIFKTFVIIIVLLIVSLSIMNSLLKSIKERTKEIGTLRSLGYTKSLIRNIFYVEVGLLSLFGSFVGAIISLTATLFINNLNISYKAGQFVEPNLMSLAIEPINYIVVSFYILVLSLVGCFFVVKETLSKTVAENLTHA